MWDSGTEGEEIWQPRMEWNIFSWKGPTSPTALPSEG